MTVGPFTAACFLACLILFALAIAAIWWGWTESRYSLRLKRRLRITERQLADAQQQRDDAERRLRTYRQWADGHIDLASQPAPTPEDQEQ